MDKFSFKQEIAGISQTVTANIGKGILSKPILHAMVGGAALTVLSGCGSTDDKNDKEQNPITQNNHQEDVREVSNPLGGSWNNQSVGLSQYVYKTFTKVSGHRYVACLVPNKWRYGFIFTLHW